MSDKKLNLSADDLQDIEDAINNSPDDLLDSADKSEIEEYNKRKKEIAKFKKELEEVQKMENKDWAEAVLKYNTNNMMIAQKVAIDDIEEHGDTRKLTSMAELGNAITNAAKSVVDIKHGEEQIALQRHKNELREKEISSKNGSEIIDGCGKTIESIGRGSTADMLKLLKTASNEEALEEPDSKILEEGSDNPGE